MHTPTNRKIQPCKNRYQNSLRHHLLSLVFIKNVCFLFAVKLLMLIGMMLKILPLAHRQQLFLYCQPLLRAQLHRMEECNLSSMRMKVIVMKMQTNNIRIRTIRIDIIHFIHRTICHTFNLKKHTTIIVHTITDFTVKYFKKITIFVIVKSFHLVLFSLN